MVTAKERYKIRVFSPLQRKYITGEIDGKGSNVRQIRYVLRGKIANILDELTEALKRSELINDDVRQSLFRFLTELEMRYGFCSEIAEKVNKVRRGDAV